MRIYDLSIFIFRRDLRLTDNIGLISALELSKCVLPVFILTPEQLINNKYKSNNSIQFMMESLTELNNDLNKKKSKLFYFYGKPKFIINNIIKDIKPDAIFVNMDYTPYSKDRDNDIKDMCDNHDIVFKSYEDILLNNVGSIRTGSNNVYQKFTPYFNKARRYKVLDVRQNRFSNYYSKNLKIKYEFKSKLSKFYDYNDNISVRGGRSYALNILKNVNNFNKYNSKRNILSINTTRLSAYIKYGCVSIREVYHKFKNVLGTMNDLIKQLYWRDFYYNILYYNGRLVTGRNKNFNKNYSKVPWIILSNASNKQKKYFKNWCNGNTGYPIVDAAMREMHYTVFFQNYLFFLYDNPFTYAHNF